MDACFHVQKCVWLLHAFPASVSVTVCVCMRESEKGRAVQVVTDAKEFVNFALESGQKRSSFSIFSFVSRIYE